jgi:small subunit ribosomal protein S9
MADIKSLDDLKSAVGAAPAAEAAPRVAVRDKLGRSYATGKRKDAVARVWVKPGSGKVLWSTARTIRSISRVPCCR